MGNNLKSRLHLRKGDQRSDRLRKQENEPQDDDGNTNEVDVDNVSRPPRATEPTATLVNSSFSKADQEASGSTTRKRT
jgi:hypothetical protein